MHRRHRLAGILNSFSSGGEATTLPIRPQPHSWRPRLLQEDSSDSIRVTTRGLQSFRDALRFAQLDSGRAGVLTQSDLRAAFSPLGCKGASVSHHTPYDQPSPVATSQPSLSGAWVPAWLLLSWHQPALCGRSRNERRIPDGSQP